MHLKVNGSYIVNYKAHKYIAHFSKNTFLAINKLSTVYGNKCGRTTLLSTRRIDIAVVTHLQPRRKTSQCGPPFFQD